MVVLVCGVAWNEVTGQYNVSRATISRLVERVNVTRITDDRTRSGAPRVKTICQENMIHQRHLRDKFMTAQITSHAVIGNYGRPNHRDTMITCLR